MEIEMVTKVDIDVPTLARIFAQLDDDDMCQFFVEVHRQAELVGPQFANQWYYLGGHLRNCKCSNEGTREMLRNIVHWMDHSTHGVEDTIANMLKFNTQVKS